MRHGNLCPPSLYRDQLRNDWGVKKKKGARELDWGGEGRQNRGFGGEKGVWVFAKKTTHRLEKKTRE